MIRQHVPLILLALLACMQPSAWAQYEIDEETLMILKMQAPEIDWVEENKKAVQSLGLNMPEQQQAAQPRLSPQEIMESSSEITDIGQAYVTKYAGLQFREIESTLFTDSEAFEIRNARRSIGEVTVRAPKSRQKTEDLPMPPPEERYITLSGILYTAKDDWVVWLNGKQIRPNALPEEVISFEVFPDYVQVKWYDDYTNQIIPLRLRPMQRFNIDQRIFLPGGQS